MSHLQEIPYSTIKETGRKYEIYTLVVGGYSFREVAQQYGVSSSTIIHHYGTVLLDIMRCYINHLSIVHGYNTSSYFSNLWSDVEQCYCGRQYAIIYFEREYSAILDEYRAGEPGMPATLLKTLPPYRKKFSAQTTSSVVRLRDTNGMTFSAIGKRLRMTCEKAYFLYSHYYHLKFKSLVQKIIDITGEKDVEIPYYKRYRTGCGKSIYNALVKDYPEFVEND